MYIGLEAARGARTSKLTPGESRAAMLQRLNDDDNVAIDLQFLLYMRSRDSRNSLCFVQDTVASLRIRRRVCIASLYYRKSHNIRRWSWVEKEILVIFATGNCIAVKNLAIGIFNGAHAQYAHTWANPTEKREARACFSARAAGHSGYWISSLHR